MTARARVARFIWDARGWLGALAISTVITIGIYDLWKIDLRVPLSYTGQFDEMYMLMTLKALAEPGGIYQVAQGGAPFGALLYDYPTPEPLVFGVLRILGLFGLTPFQLFNVLTLVPFPLTALTTYAAARRFKVGRGLSILMGVVYTFLPFHIMRAVGHTLLASYWIVPLAMMLAVELASGRRLFFLPRGVVKVGLPRPGRPELFALGILAVSGMTGSGYWQFFSASLLGFSGIVGAMKRRSIAPLLDGLVSGAVIGVSLFCSLLPNTLWLRAHGPATVNPRFPQEAEHYGLKIGQLLIPQDWHRWAPLRKIAQQYDESLDLINENHMSSLGLIGSVAFVVMMLVLLTPPRLTASSPVPQSAEDDAHRAAAIRGASQLGLASVLLGTIGGFGALFAVFVSPTIRCYNRLSIYVEFFALLALVLLVQRYVVPRLRTGAARVRFHGVLVALGALAVYDQTNTDDPRRDSAQVTSARFHAHQSFVSRIETKIPEGAIYQLPYVALPQDATHGVTFGYSFFQGYLGSRNLSWSFGGLVGRDPDLWHRHVTALPAQDMLDTLAYTGFTGVWLGLRGYPEMGKELTAELTSKLGAPITQNDERDILVFDLRPYAAALRARTRDWDTEREIALHPLSVAMASSAVAGKDSGCYDEEHDQKTKRAWTWCRSQGVVRFTNPGAQPRRARFRARLGGGPGTVTFDGIAERTLELREQAALDFEVTVPPGHTDVHVRTTAANVAPKGESRDLRFFLENYTLEPVR